VTVVLEHGMDDLARITSGLRDGGVGVIAFELHRPSLDDVFFELTGQPPQADDDTGTEPVPPDPTDMNDARGVTV
jgi:ABC-2 type transport system ATP-binding protein